MVLWLLIIFEVIQAILTLRNNDLIPADQRHLVTSAKTVLQRNIPLEQPLIISVPNNATDAGHIASRSIQPHTYDLMLQAINEESQWPLLTTNSEVVTPKNSMKDDVSSAVYIVLSSGHEASNIAVNLIYQLVDLKGKEYLNNRASFFLVMTDSFEFPQQSAENTRDVPKVMSNNFFVK